MVDIFGNIRGAESGGNRFARNPKSSAYGPDQWLSGSWLSAIKKHRPDLAVGKTNAELLAMRSDENLSGEMTRAYAGDNAGYLRSRGLDPAGNTYLAHFLGPSGASSVLSNPGASAGELLGPNVIAANPFLRGMKGSDVVNWARSKETGKPVGASDAMAANLRRRFGTATEGGAVAPVATDRLKSAISKSYDPDKIASAEALTKSGQQIAGSSGNALGAIGGSILAGLGGYQRGQETTAKKEHDSALGNALMNSGSAKDTIGALMGSSDPEDRKAGVELLIKSQAAKATQPIEVNGRLVMPQPDGTFKEVYAAPPKEGALPDDVQKYQFDMAQRKAAGQPDVSYGDWRKANAAADGGAFSKNVIWGTKDGKPALIQPGGEAKAALTELPPGFELAKDPIKVDAGTHWSILDPQTRQEINRIPKDVEGEARLKEVGKGQGERTIAQPATISAVRSSVSGLDRLADAATTLKNRPGLPSMTGVIQGSGWVPTISQDTANAETDLDTLKSQVSFNVLQAMRDASKTGGALGSIAVQELLMLQNNLASLDTRQGDEKFKQSLDAIVDYTKDAKARLLQGYRDTYGQDFGSMPKSAAPQAGPNPGAVAQPAKKTLRYNPATDSLE